MWVVGVPVGMYLVFIARPSYDLIGLWAGLVTGGEIDQHHVY